ncbi:hypothetical protein CANARDRAFT_23365 [[Candida] arabinofermentans NRRL YB-2248]|uniref:Mitochondrial resolvase Ydc2 catalytic domain-containing protein n=1 Tax=[Candida] arabinofermentans NRRL YB-2248 TaxID=983967 RepID=A0A1E4T0M8_9ASCO|nr:hypothetical protein CANARDRAFT_23365 [[Candida] arabinofermentans NRRL YB-2248]
MAGIDAVAFGKAFRELVLSQKSTVSVLSSISKRCGILPDSSSTKKAVLVEQITSQISAPSLINNHDYQSAPFRLLSIDMGLKNFSFCRLEIPSFPMNGNYKPVVKQWNKMNLNEYTGITDDRFIPTNYSGIVNKIISNLIFNPESLQTKPDLIIIERQRFRTGGHKNVQEHILKTNVLEFSLISALQTCTYLQPKKYNSKLQSVSPAAMAGYWVDYCKLRDPKIDQKSKDLRVDLVHEWLSRHLLGSPLESIISEPEFIIGDNFDLSETTDDLIHLKKYRSNSKRVYKMVKYLNTKNKTGEIIIDDSESSEKGDDMADSLLHGLAYVHYELNRLKLIEAVNNNERLDKF